MTQTVLVVGATGMLGSRIAAHLVDVPETRFRLLVRSGAMSKLGDLPDRGAEVLEGDLANIASLDRATQGVDVIVSAVQGGPEVIVDG